MRLWSRKRGTFGCILGTVDGRRGRGVGKGNHGVCEGRESGC